ncbi:hypothetical protein BJX65DRAFT_264238, partial [Aspergillus insuetus]
LTIDLHVRTAASLHQSFLCLLIIACMTRSDRYKREQWHLNGIPSEKINRLFGNEVATQLTYMDGGERGRWAL